MAKGVENLSNKSVRQSSVDKDVLIWPAEVYFIQIKSRQGGAVYPNFSCSLNHTLVCVGLCLFVCYSDETAKLSWPEEDQGY